MKILFTGSSSKIGEKVLRELVSAPQVEKIYCGVHRNRPQISSGKIEFFDLNLSAPCPIPQADLLVHFAGLTHAENEAEYLKINTDGTSWLARAAKQNGCTRVVYVSSRCATDECGSYGQSKLKAEQILSTLNFEALCIIRPSEIYGSGSNEGIDQFISMAKKAHIVPMLVGNKNIAFAPLHFEDFVRQTVKVILSIPGSNGGTITNIEMCGPEVLNGVKLALRLAKKYKALPVPVPYQVFKTGLVKISPDQVARLIGRKTSAVPSNNTGISITELKRL